MQYLKFSQNTVEFLIKIGPLLSGIGLIVGSITAIFTFIKIAKRQVDDQWIDRFRELYNNFWQSGDMAEMRKSIINEDDYLKISIVVSKRLSSNKCELLSKEYDELERLDRFCSLLVRLKAFRLNKMSSRQRQLVDDVLIDYWVERLLERKELKEYVHRYWKILYPNAPNQGQL